MTDTKEFNKSLDRIAKALGGEEWSPEDKPEAIYKLLDKIADKLEENGAGGGGALNVVCSIEQGTHGETTYTLDKTWKQIHDAFTAGTMVIVLRDNGIYWAKDIVLYIGRDTVDEQTTYTVGFGGGYDVLSLMTDAENGYPTYTMT